MKILTLGLLLALLSVLYAGDSQPCSRVVHLESPQYPEVARQARIQGTVKATVRLSAAGQGTVVEATGASPLLTREAENNLKKWVFVPGTQERLQVDYEFRLEGPEVGHVPQPIVSFDLPNKVLIVSHPPVPIKDFVIVPQKH